MDSEAGLIRKNSKSNVTGIRWGIMGTGRVCNDFVQALKTVECAIIEAVCSRSLEKAQKFASIHGISRALGSYEELANDPDVDVVYDGTLHIFHRRNAEMSLNAGKHCLVEKPFTCTIEDAEFLVNLAREKGKFIMEGIWTRFFPAVRTASDIIKMGGIGTVVSVQSEFCFHALSDNETPDGDMFKVEKGGGGAFYVGPYLASMACLGFSGQEPKDISTSGMIGSTGIDTMAGILMKYDTGMATLVYSLLCESDEETTIIGTSGRIRIHTPYHCPSSITVTKKLPGRGNVEKETLEFPLPEVPDKIEASGGFVYPNSIGFAYEAAEVQRCIQEGLVESPHCTHQDTLTAIKVLCTARKQIGVEDIATNSI